VKLYVGLVAPKQYVVDIVPGDSDLDLSTVTAATFQIRKPDGSTTSWTATLSNQTATTLTLTFTYGASSEIDQAGTWHFYAKFTVPGGFERTEDWVEDVLLEHG
jgi:hypothetical protein